MELITQHVWLMSIFLYLQKLNLENSGGGSDVWSSLPVSLSRPIIINLRTTSYHARLGIIPISSATRREVLFSACISLCLPVYTVKGAFEVTSRDRFGLSP